MVGSEGRGVLGAEPCEGTGAREAGEPRCQTPTREAGFLFIKMAPIPSKFLSSFSSFLLTLSSLSRFPHACHSSILFLNPCLRDRGTCSRKVPVAGVSLPQQRRTGGASLVLATAHPSMARVVPFRTSA